MLKLSLIKGVGWSVSGRLVGRLIDVAVLLVLARVLAPAEFGLTALAIALITVIDTALELPVTQALTRLETLDKDHYDTAFTLSVLRGVAFSLIVLALAWPFAQVYGDDRLFALAAFLSLAPFARGIYSPRMIDAMRDLRFAPVFVSQLIGKLFGAGLAIWVLLDGGGYWAIAVNNVAAAAGGSAISYVLAPYRPAFSLARFKDFSGFIGWFGLSQIVAAVSWQLDRFLLGTGVSKSELGQYTMASDLAVLPAQSLIAPAMQPVMSAFSKLNKDPARLGDSFVRVATLVTMVTAPICILICAASGWIAHVLFDDQWPNIQRYIFLLALTVIPGAYASVFSTLALSVNQASMVFKLNIIEFGMRLVLLPAGLYFYSVIGVIGARGAIAVAVLFLCVYLAKSLVGARILAQLSGLAKVLAGSLVMSVCIYLTARLLRGFDLGLTVETIIMVLSGSIAYLTAMYCVGAKALLTRGTQADNLAG